MIDLARRSFVAYKVHGKPLLEAVRSIPGAKYDAKADAWMFPIACASYVAEYANDHAVQMTESARLAVMNLVTNRDAGIDLPDLDAPLASGRTLFAHQKEGIRFLIRRRYAILADDMGLGKALENGTPVLTPTGFVPIESLTVGDMVIAQDGTPSRVMGVYPQGVRDMYRVTFADKASIRCDAEHLWEVQTPNRKMCGKAPLLLATAEMIDRGVRDGAGNCKFFIPVCDAVEFAPASEPLPVDPYLLGVLTGDGHLNGVSVSITKGDAQLWDFVLPVLPEGARPSFDGITCRIYGDGKVNPLLSRLRALDIADCRSYDKHIPTRYLTASIDERVRLLCGLMDTDGYAAADGTLQYSTASPQLADDFTFLVRSLGGIVHRTCKEEPKYMHKGEKRTGRPSHILTLALPDKYAIPFRLTRKAVRASIRPKYKPSRAIRSIEPDGRAEATCIAIDHPSRLYVADQFIVTHNTTTSLVAALHLGGSVHVICPASLRENWVREADMAGIKIQTHSWAKVPARLLAPYILIADEAHYIQSGNKSQRGKAFLALAKDADAVICLTGTPMKNGRPVNLYPLLKAVRSPLAADKSWYERRYCDVKTTHWSRWDASGACRLPELGRRCAPVMLRRMKDECLDLPEKIRVMRQADVTADARRAYEAELDRLVSRSEKEPDALAMFTYLRMASSQAKIESACTVIDEVLEQGGQIVVFTAFLGAARTLAARYDDAALLIGETAQDERQRLVDAFQAGQRRVFVTTFGAGGVGITLTRAQTVILVDRPWTPGDCYQAEDRIHRIGQTGSSVLSIWLQWDDTDKAVDALLEAKTERIEVVMHGRKVEVEANISLQRFAEMATRK